jgi:acetyltransferase-like isoleucine patch superfamily enzyme
MYLNNPLVKPFLRLFGVKVGKNAKFYGLPVIVRDKKSEINIGNDFTLSSAFLANLIGLYQRSVIVSRFGAKIEIGNNVGMSGVSVYAMDSVKIGNDTIIGGNTKIFDSDLHH